MGGAQHSKSIGALLCSLLGGGLPSVAQDATNATLQATVQEPFGGSRSAKIGRRVGLPSSIHWIPPCTAGFAGKFWAEWIPRRTVLNCYEEL